MRFVAEVDGEAHRVEVDETGGRFRVKIGEEVWEVDARWPGRGRCSLLIGGASFLADVTEEAGQLLVEVGGDAYRIRVEEEIRHLIRLRGAGHAGGGAQVLAAPLPGKVVHVSISEGQEVKAGDALLVIEAMKMENEFKASGPGIVKEVRVAVGQAVNAGDVLVVIE